MNVKTCDFQGIKTHELNPKYVGVIQWGKCQMSKPKAQKNGSNFLALGFWILFVIGILTFGIARTARVFFLSCQR
jgi:hypothetical protein